MREYLKQYKCTLQVLGPVYIGSGSTINKKEYIFHRASNTVYIPNQVKMMGFFIQKGILDEFEKYLLTDNRDFAAWLREKKIDETQYKGFCEYSLHSGDAVFEDKGKKEIQTFIKDAYNCPYVPGSSLKGALRTALFSHEIMKNPKRYARNIEELRCKELRGKNSMNREMKAFEKAVFSKKVSEKDSIDKLCGLRVSDSLPLSTGDLTLCQKIDLRVDKTKGCLPILREALMPKTSIQFTVEIDSSICTYTIEDIKRAIATFSKQYDENFRSAFSVKPKAYSNILLLGGGVGYASKTVSYPALGKQGVKRISQLIDETLSYKAKKEHAHHKDAQLGVSPHIFKMTTFQNNHCEMGLCSISFE